MTKIVSTGRTLFSEEFYKKKQKERKARFLVAIFGLIFIALVLVILSRMERFRISAVTVEGNKVVNKEAITQAVNKNLSGYYFYLVPRNNTILYSEDSLKVALAKEFPRFSSVDIALESPQSLKVSVSERKPYALYCGISEMAENSLCYFLDENGFIFDLSPSFSNGVYFVYGREDAFEDPLGKEFLPSAEFKKLSQFIERLRTFGFEPQTLLLWGDDIKVISNEHKQADLILKRVSNLDLIYSNLESFLWSEPIKNEKDFLEKAKLIDLTIENKVFYSFK